MTPAPAGTTPRQKALLVSASVLLALAALELLARLLPQAMTLITVPSPVPGVGYQIAPRSTVWTPEGRFRINRWGFRSEEFPRAKPRGEARLFVLGDSVAFGQGVAAGDFPAALERLLAERPPAEAPGRVRVVNTAVPSYSTCQELALLKGLLGPMEPNAVLVAYVFNDPEGARTPFGLDLATGRIHPLWRAYHWVKQHVRLVRVAWVQLAPTITRLRGHAYYGPPADPADTVRYVRALHDPAGSFWRRCAECIDGLGAWQRETGVPVLFAVFPVLDRMGSPELREVYRQVAGAARRAGLEVVDLHAELQSAPPEELKSWHTGDGVHLSEEGHRRVAAILHRRLLAPGRWKKGRALPGKD